MMIDKIFTQLMCLFILGYYLHGEEASARIIIASPVPRPYLHYRIKWANRRREFDEKLQISSTRSIAEIEAQL